ncbi:MAG TPA: hypothetical protein VE861_03565 [Gemmatimonadaceae bacterium]|nr:hypothetical protein [Gemmatimonadaceae bacterium]
MSALITVGTLIAALLLVLWLERRMLRHRRRQVLALAPLPATSLRLVAPPGNTAPQHRAGCRGGSYGAGAIRPATYYAPLPGSNDAPGHVRGRIRSGALIALTCKACGADLLPCLDEALVLGCACQRVVSRRLS